MADLIRELCTLVQIEAITPDEADRMLDKYMRGDYE